MNASMTLCRVAGLALLTGILAVSGLPAARGLAADELSVPVTIKEPAGVARHGFPATGGIPFKVGQVKDVADLTLVDAKGAGVPAQFSKLAGYDDGSVQWALLDVVVPELPANGAVGYTVKPGKDVLPPSKPLTIKETDEKVVFDTGEISFTVNKKHFNLFDDVAVGGLPTKVVTGSTVDLLNCELGERTLKPESNRESTVVAMKEGGKVFPCKTDAPTRVKWEYKGPVRATLRIDGPYVGDGGAPLAYTTRITAWAGCPVVRVEHSIRNSNPAEGRDAYIQRAAITLKLGFPARSQAHDVAESIWVGDKPVMVTPPPGSPAAAAAPTSQPAKKKKSTPGDYSAKPCNDWCSGGDGQFGLVILDRHTGGVYRGPGTYLHKVMDGSPYVSWPGLFAQSIEGDKAVVELVSPGPKLEGKAAERGALGFTGDGTFALADRSHKDTEVWFDFYAGTRDVAANDARANACRSKLLAVAPAEWYSQTETLGAGHFGTLADEIACYKAWGWKGWDNTAKYPKMPHQAFAFVPYEAIHDVSEDDAVEGYLLQYLRTGERGFFDWGEAFDGFFRCHAITRADTGPAWGTNAMAGRTNKGMSFGWYGPNYYDWSDTRMHHCHEYGRGVFDYYCLTGNTDSMEAGLDLAAEMTAGWDRKGGGGDGVHFSREFGRKFNTVLRAYQLTRDPQWKKIADHWADGILKASNWDAEKNVYLQSMGSYTDYFTREWAIEIPNKPYSVPQRMKDYMVANGLSVEKVHGEPFAKKGDQKWQIYIITQVFELSECHQSMERYARIMNSEPMKKRLVDVTRGIITYFWSEKCQFMRDRVFLNWPVKDKAMDPADWLPDHDKCPNDPCGVHSGYSTRYIADMCARAYSFSGDTFFLDWAKKCWDRGSKRLYQQDHQIAGPNEVGEFAYIRGPHSDTVLECSARLFYEASRGRPQPK